MTCDVAILAGGAGTRLRDRTGDLPKPLVPVAGIPALEHQFAACARHGFSRILLLVHFRHDAIRAHVGDGSRFGVTVEYEVEEQARGTAGALCAALHRVAPTFLVLYGDTYLDVDLRRMVNAHSQRGADATLFVHPNDHPYDSDLVELNADGFVTALHAKSHWTDERRRNLVNGALYVIQRDVLEGMPRRKGMWDIARDLFPRMVREGRRLFAYRSPEYIKDIGTPERLDSVARDIAAGVPERLSGRQLRSAVFLDRDGTLNVEVDYLLDAARLELHDGVASAIHRLNAAGHLVVVVTNQSAVARGQLTFEALDAIHARLDHLLGSGGAYLDAIYVCPHHPHRGFPGELPELKIACDCRKPRTGSIDAACRDLQIDRAASWIVGDTTSDIETGRRAGLRTMLVRTGYAGQDGKYAVSPDYVAENLPAAAGWILEGHGAMSRRLAPVAVAALDTRLILVGGLARAGKSFAAQVLRELLAAFGREAHVLPLDSWLKPAADRAEGTGVMQRFDIQAAVAAIQPLVLASDRARLQLPVYDRARRTLHPAQLDFSIGPDDALIVEGVPALLSDELVRLAEVRVYVEMPEPERLSLLRADYRWRGESEGAVAALLASRAADEVPLVRQSRARATAVVPAWLAS